MQPIRVAILLGTTYRWVVELMQEAVESPLVDLVAIIQGVSQQDTPSHPLVDLYMGMDARVFGRGTQPSNVIEMPDALAGVARIDLTPDSLNQLRDLDIHVLMSPGPVMMSGELAKVTRDGLLFFNDDLYASAYVGPHGFWELFHKAPVANVSLYAQRPDDDHPYLTERGYAQRNAFAIARTRNRRLRLYKRLAMKKLTMLHHFGADEALKPIPETMTADKKRRRPGVMHVFRVALRSFVLAALGIIDKLYRDSQWIVFYRYTPGSSEPSQDARQFTKLAPGRDRMWADPFVIHHDGVYHIFIEEFPYSIYRGHICVMQVTADGKLTEPVPVLQTDYHLAYPHVFQWNDSFYMLPDNDSHRVELHKCVSFPHEWQLERILMEGKVFSDATLIEIDGVWWMFVAQADSYQLALEELHLYYADSPLGPFQPHPRNPVKIDVRSARPAGELFRRDDKLIRPAQGCAVRYGHRLVLCEVTRLTKDEYEETEIDATLPDWDRELLGTHTFNHRDEVTVIDGVRLVRPIKSGSS